MTIREQIKLVEKSLTPWVRKNGGVLSIASDIYELCTLLQQSPKAMRVVIMWKSQDKRGAYEEMGAVDREFWVVVSRGSGMALKPGANLVEGVAGGRPMFDLIDELVTEIRKLSFAPATTEGTPDYRGTEPFSFEGYLTDAMKNTFTIGTQLPAIPTGGEA